MPEETGFPAAATAIEYAYSNNGEDWTSDWCSFLSQNDELAPGDECQRGVIQYADPAEFVDSDAVIDSMADNAASSDLGEWADDFPNVSAEAKQELEDFLDTWARKKLRLHVLPRQEHRNVHDRCRGIGPRRGDAMIALAYMAWLIYSGPR